MLTQFSKYDGALPGPIEQNRANTIVETLNSYAMRFLILEKGLDHSFKEQIQNAKQDIIQYESTTQKILDESDINKTLLFHLFCHVIRSPELTIKSNLGAQFERLIAARIANFPDKLLSDIFFPKSKNDLGAHETFSVFFNNLCTINMVNIKNKRDFLAHFNAYCEITQAYWSKHERVLLLRVDKQYHKVKNDVTAISQEDKLLFTIKAHSYSESRCFDSDLYSSFESKQSYPTSRKV